MGNSASHLSAQRGTSWPLFFWSKTRTKYAFFPKSFLQTAGHTTLSAGSIEQALALLSSPEPIDLLFIDLNLKGESEAGFSLAVQAVETRPALFAVAFRKGLNDTGYVEGQNVTVEYHWLEGKYDRLSTLVADLVRRRVAVFVTPGTVQAALAAKVATATIPIAWSCRQPRSAWRQRDGHQYLRPGGGSQAAAAPA